MAARRKKNRWFLRDISAASVLLILAGVVVGVFVSGFDWPKLKGERSVDGTLPPNYEAHYEGAIIFPTEELGICLVASLDNRTGGLQAKGYAHCDDIKIKAPQRITPEMARLSAVGNAFHR